MSAQTIDGKAFAEGLRHKVGTLAAREPELIDGLDPYGRPVRKLKAALVRFRIDSRLRSHLK